jgi:hypothetical protein
VASGTSIEQGLLPEGRGLEIVSEMNEGGTIFADGIEDDRLDFAWGMRLQVALAPRACSWSRREGQAARSRPPAPADDAERAFLAATMRPASTAPRWPWTSP